MASAAFWLQSSTHTLPLLQQRLSKLCSAYSLLIEFSSAFILRLSSDPSMSAQQPRCLHCLSGHISLRKHFIFFSMSEKQRAIPELYCSPGHQRALPMLPCLCPQQCTAPYPPDSSFFSCPVFTSRVKHSFQSSPGFHFCCSYVHILICVLWWWWWQGLCKYSQATSACQFSPMLCVVDSRERELYFLPHLPCPAHTTGEWL